MDIKWKLGHDLPDGSRRTSSIEISLDADDDPDGYIVGLLQYGRLEAFLKCFPFLDRFPAEDKLDAREMLMNFAYVANHCQGLLGTLQLAARDQFGLGWGAIASAVEGNRSTVRGQILAARDRAAERGYFWDPDGLHHTDPATARTTALMADIGRDED